MYLQHNKITAALNNNISKCVIKSFNQTES